MILIGKYPSIKLPYTYSLFIKFKKFDQRLVDLVKSLPTRYYIPDQKVWEIPLSDIDRLVYAFGVENITPFNDIPEYDMYLQSLQKQQTRQDIEKLKEYYRIIKPIVDFEFKSKPMGHQIEAFNMGIQQPSILITDVMGLGKALKYGTRVITPKGYVKIEDLKVGDEVFAIDGTPTKVLAVYDHVQKNGYKVTFSDGQEVICCEDHLWEVHQNKKYNVVIRSTKELAQMRLINKVNNRGWKNRYSRWVPLCEPVQFPAKEVKIDPYLLGLLLGDGIFTKDHVEMCLNDLDVEFVCSYLDKLGMQYKVRKSRPNATDIIFIKDSDKELIKALEFYGLKGRKSLDKFIPKDYLFNSIDVRLAILQGLLDTDGYIPKDNMIQFTSASIKLAEQVAFLAESFGAVVNIDYHESRYKKDGRYIQCHGVLILTIRYKDPRMFVRFPRRLQNLKPCKYPPKRAFVSIEPIGKIDCRCITVDHPRSLYLIEGFIATHNTASALYITDYRIKQELVKHCLIICCINGNKYNWQNEIAKHSWHNCQVIDGTKKQRLEKIDNYWMFRYNIINIESIRDEEILKKLINLIDKEEIQCVIVDEFHKASNRKSQQGRNLVKLNPPYKIGLSGTPITKRIERAWSILNWMGVEPASEWKFKQRYCVFGGYSGWDVIGYKNLKELHQKIDRIQIRRTKDILDLPPKTRRYYYVDMTPAQQKEYTIIKQGIIHDLETGNLTTLNPSVVTLRLRQFTDTIKYDAVKQVVDELVENDEPCVIFSCYKKPLYDLAEMLKKYNPLVVTGDIAKSEDRQALVDKFQNDKKHKVMLGTIDALGTGFTLTRSSYVLFLNKHYVQPYNEQAEDRCHRIGSTNNVTIISFIVKNSVDEKVEQILQNDKMYIDLAVDGKVSPAKQKELIDILLGD